MSNPEFIREGAPIEDFKRPDFVVVGAPDERSRAVMERLYRALSLNRASVVFTDRRSSELVKYAANASSSPRSLSSMTWRTRVSAPARTSDRSDTALAWTDESD